MGMCNSSGLVKLNLDDICPTTEEHIAIETKFEPFLQVDNPNNINHKYSHLAVINSLEYTGKSIKKTNSYVSKVSKEELEKKRSEFWETRIEGCKETWTALKFACQENELSTIIEVLKAAGIKLIKKNIQMCYDEELFRYDLPLFLINEPSCYKEDREEKEDIVKADINVTLRVTGADHKIVCSTTEACVSIKEKLKKVMDTQGKSVRLFYSGKELADLKKIGNYLTSDGVIIVFLRSA